MTVVRDAAAAAAPAATAVARSIGPLYAYAAIEERARAARTLPELIFTIANETWQLFGYRQGIVWQLSDGRPRLRTVSGLARLTEDSPYTVWLKRLGRWLGERVAQDAEFVGIEDVPTEFAEGWREWLPDWLYVLPITTPANADAGRVAIVAFAVEDPPDESTQELALRLMGTYGHAWGALAPRRRMRPRLKRSVLAVAALAALAALALVPVRVSVLAPAEIVALDALAIASPMDGVVQKFDVQPNQPVSRGQRLFTLDDTTLRNRREVAAKQLQVARADALAAAQKAFSQEASRAELASLNGKVAERQAELVYVEDLLKRIEVRSPGDGVLVFGDVNDWQGKPVVTGERVALLADPKDAGILIWLPVADAVNLEAGAEVKLYLQVSPLTPLRGTLFQTSYQAASSPEGISAYRLRARFEALSDGERELARIGLKGTAKLYGERAPLGYYLFRRPLATVREWTGW
jgi:multidrug resistance efflux pump